MAIQPRLLRWHEQHGRHGLPWRGDHDPYRVVVSEFMLHQTQVQRVVPAFTRFIARYPNFHALANAGAGDVIRAWSGLGYNGRALRLKALADQVVRRFDGELPRDRERLRELPGIGEYSAAAIRAFAFNLDEAAVDTNVARVVHRLRYGIEHPPVHGPSQLRADARQLLPPGKARAWNAALMDFGSAICTARAPKCPECPLRPQCAAAPLSAARLAQARRVEVSAKQPLPFRETARFVRGRIVAHLGLTGPGLAVSRARLHRHLQQTFGVSSARADGAIAGLRRDGLIVQKGTAFQLPER